MQRKCPIVTKRSCSCPPRPAKCDDRISTEPDFQPFPTTGPLRLNVPHSVLQAVASHEQSGEVYAYVVRTARSDDNDLGKVKEFGSAPNYLGGRITLCNCKHSMRAGKNSHEWKGVWIAGLASIDRNHMQRLFYLMRVGQAFESHCELWNALPDRVRAAKSMYRHHLGDLFEPKVHLKPGPEANFDPKNYKKVHPEHPHRDSWEQDLDYRPFDRFGRCAPLLLGEQNRSFLWSEPSLAYKGIMHQGCKKFDSLMHFLQHLRSAHTFYGNIIR
jgi:hypothetical protein